MTKQLLKLLLLASGAWAPDPFPYKQDPFCQARSCGAPPFQSPDLQFCYNTVPFPIDLPAVRNLRDDNVNDHLRFNPLANGIRSQRPSRNIGTPCYTFQRAEASLKRTQLFNRDVFRGYCVIDAQTADRWEMLYVMSPIRDEYEPCSLDCFLFPHYLATTTSALACRDIPSDARTHCPSITFAGSLNLYLSALAACTLDGECTTTAKQNEKIQAYWPEARPAPMSPPNTFENTLDAINVITRSLQLPFVHDPLNTWRAGRADEAISSGTYQFVHYSPRLSSGAYHYFLERAQTRQPFVFATFLNMQLSLPTAEEQQNLTSSSAAVDPWVSWTLLWQPNPPDCLNAGFLGEASGGTHPMISFPPFSQAFTVGLIMDVHHDVTTDTYRADISLEPHQESGSACAKTQIFCKALPAGQACPPNWQTIQDARSWSGQVVTSNGQQPWTFLQNVEKSESPVPCCLRTP